GLLMDADMRSTQRIVLACQQVAQLLEKALEATKEIKKETNQNGKRRYNHGKKANQQVMWPRSVGEELVHAYVVATRDISYETALF
ncbi:hypothetical protein Taro_054869, partial [Colocasia esculenta]|nr:hypothetical protein [Colocasia esculenta]